MEGEKITPKQHRWKIWFPNWSCSDLKMWLHSSTTCFWASRLVRPDVPFGKVRRFNVSSCQTVLGTVPQGQCRRSSYLLLPGESLSWTDWADAPRQWPLYRSSCHIGSSSALFGLALMCKKEGHVEDQIAHLAPHPLCRKPSFLWTDPQGTTGLRAFYLVGCTDRTVRPRTNMANAGVLKTAFAGRSYMECCLCGWELVITPSVMPQHHCLRAAFKKGLDGYILRSVKALRYSKDF